MNTAHQLHAFLIDDVKRRIIEESIPRLRKCLGLLTHQDIWYRPNDELVSVGNLILHICGNARQWIISGLGGQQDVRTRAQEFEEQGPLPTSKLLKLLSELETDLIQVLDQLSPAQLIQSHSVQVFEENGVSILVHATEHFSYHTGQVSYFTKLRRGIDLGYYANLVLE